MALPFNTPYTFATATGSIPLSQLDSNFSTVVQAVNAIGNGANALSNVTITGGTVTNVSITALSGPVPVGSGGTGLSNITANAVILGNGTSAVTVVSPGSSGNVLTSNGTTWISQAGGLPSVTGNAGKSLITDGSTASWDSAIVRATAVTASGTTVPFTGIPSWVRRVTVGLRNVSTNGAVSYLLQLGTSGGYVTTGYFSYSARMGGSALGGETSSGGFVVAVGSSTAAVSGIITLVNVDANLWVAHYGVSIASSEGTFGAGQVSLSGTLDRLRLNTTNGTDSYDAGTVNIFWE